MGVHTVQSALYAYGFTEDMQYFKLLNSSEWAGVCLSEISGTAEYRYDLSVLSDQIWAVHDRDRPLSIGAQPISVADADLRQRAILDAAVEGLGAPGSLASDLQSILDCNCVLRVNLATRSATT